MARYRHVGPDMPLTWVNCGPASARSPHRLPALAPLSSLKKRTITAPGSVELAFEGLELSYGSLLSRGRDARRLRDS